MVGDLLEGAARVLQQRGAAGFTTNHVAAATGVSIGSVYQYFPNKAELLLRLHERDTNALWSSLRLTLLDPSRPPRERFERVLDSAFTSQLAAREHHHALARAGVSTRPSAGIRPFTSA